MKKKRFLWLLVLVVICCTTCLFACTPVKLGGGPKSTDDVYGNGGSAVVKGDYLYFTNAYKNYEDIGVNDNEYNAEQRKNKESWLNAKRYGIYRIKLNEAGTVDITDDGNNTPQGAELLVPLVAGYSKTSLFIGGNYLFYTSPQTIYAMSQKDPTTGYIRFERVKLDGSDRQILCEKTFTTSCDYSFNHIDGTTYITIYGSKNSKDSSSSTRELYTIWSRGDNHSDKDNPNRIASSVSSYATFTQEDIYYDKNKDNSYTERAVNEVNKYVYYTKLENSRYSLYRKALKGGDEESLIIGSSEEISVVAVKNNRVYFKQNNILYSASNVEDFDDINKRTKYTSFSMSSDAKTITDFAILDDTYGTPIDRGIVAVTNNNGVYSVALFNGGTQTLLFNSSKQVNIMFTKGSQIFYTIQEDSEDAHNILYSYDYVLQGSQPEIVIYNFSSGVDDNAQSFDYDKDRVYFFGKVGDSNLNYLQMALLEENTYTNSEEESVANYIGVLDSSDVKTKEDD